MKLSLVVYTADAWEHVCPVVRITGPAAQAGFWVIHGNEWVTNRNGNTELRIYPERVAEGDLVVIQRDFPIVEEYEQVMSDARRLGKRVVYELDDLLTELPLEHPGARRYLPGRLSILRAILEADAVVGSTPRICDYLSQFNSHVVHLPNTLDDQLWQLRSPRPEESHQTDELCPPDDFFPQRPLVIGYLGSSSHLPDLAMVIPVLQQIVERYGKSLILRFWGLVPPSILRNFPNVEWNPVGMVAYRDFASFFSTQDCDIAIAPLLDSVFNRGKSPIKFLEYSALGIPGIYSRLDPYTQVVIDGQNGLLAGSLDEWEAKLTALIEDGSLRARLGSAAQETVRRDWLLSEHVDAWAQAYQQIADSELRDETPALVRKFSSSALVKAQAWQKELEISSRQMAQELEQSDREVGQVSALYRDLVEGAGWKAFQKLSRLYRKLAPAGSWRERLLRLGFYSLVVLRRAGVKGFLRGAFQKTRSSLKTLRGKDRGSPASIPAVFPSKTLLLPESTLPQPAISVVIIEDTMKKFTSGGWPTQDDVLAWLSGQTIDPAAVEVVTADSQRQWDLLKSWEELKQGLHGRYICLAYPDLLEQNSSYLEANRIALETGNLAFTVNLCGPCAWADGYLDAGFLPGMLDQPLFRLMVDKACLTGSQQLLDWNVTAWTDNLRMNFIRSGFPTNAARIIRHTSQVADVPGVLAFSNRLPAGQWQRQCSYLQVRAAGDGPWPFGAQSSISLVIHPVNSHSRQAVSPQPGPRESSVNRSAHTSDGRATVLVALQYLAVGGAEQLALNVMKVLQDRVRFVVFSVDPKEPAQATLADAFRQVTPYVYTPPDFLEPEQRLSFYVSLIERFQPESLYIANGAEAIYEALGEIKKRYPRLRTINQVYDSQVGWINYYDLRLLKRLDAHIGANQQICQAYRDKGARPESVFQIPHTIDLESLDPQAYSQERIAQLRQEFTSGLGAQGGSSEHEAHDPVRVVIFASRAHPQKRPLDFVEVARRFSNSSVIFLMFSEGPLAVQIDAAINQVGANVLIHRLPFHRPISDVLAVADVLVLPSEFEGMPLIAAEAQAMGKPVVVTDVGNNREVLAITGGGIVAPVGDVQALTLGVQQMLAQPPDPMKLRQAIIDHFSPRVVAEQYRQVLLREESHD
jgi:glycosyltransferase involved in cell wall biosynthesis